MSDRAQLVTWLKDAHALERAEIPILERHAQQANPRPELRARLERHIGETERHMETIERCLDRYGERPSTVKDALARFGGTLESFATAPFGDTLVKNVVADYSMEHMEIAAYEGIRAAASRLGDEETVRACDSILDDERDMARFLGDALPAAVDSELDLGRRRG
jgi:ferritin-like metal-binding protein YciE